VSIVAQHALHVDPNFNIAPQKHERSAQDVTAAMMGAHSGRQIDDAIAVEVGFVASGGNREMHPVIAGPSIFAKVVLNGEMQEMQAGP